MAGASSGRPARRDRVTGWLAKVFRVNTPALNWPRGVMFLDVALVPVVVVWAIGHRQYLVSAILGALFTVLADPGGAAGRRALRLTVFALSGAAVTALGFGLGGTAWGALVVVSFLFTFVASLAVMFGAHVFVGALLLNVWYLVALALGVSLHQHPVVTNHIWGQVAAWAAGSALWILVTFVVWLVGGRNDMPQPVAEIPSDTTRRTLTAPLIVFAAIRAVALGGAVAIAFGFHLSHADWLPIAALIAMKPSLEQTTVVATQRLAGTLVGAVAAGLLLLVPAAEHGLSRFAVDRGLELVAIVLLMHAIAVLFANYALYSAAIAASVLIFVDLAQPTDYSAEGDRVLWTLIGVAIGVLVMLLSQVLATRAKRTKARPRPA